MKKKFFIFALLLAAGQINAMGIFSRAVAGICHKVPGIVGFGAGAIAYCGAQDLPYRLATIGDASSLFAKYSAGKTVDLHETIEDLQGKRVERKLNPVKFIEEYPKLNIVALIGSLFAARIGYSLASSRLSALRKVDARMVDSAFRQKRADLYRETVEFGRGLKQEIVNLFRKK